MPRYTRPFSRESQKNRIRRRRDEQALTNVVSLRISDEEKKTLERVTKSTSKSVSEIIREAMNHWLAKRQRLGLDVG